MHYSYCAHKACQTVYCMFMCALTRSVLQQTLSFWTHFLAIVFIFELTYVAAVSQRWEIWGGTLCSSVLWDSLFRWALDTESVPMVVFWCTGWFCPSCLYLFSLFLSCGVPWVWSDLHNLWEQNRTEQGFNLTFIQLHHGTLLDGNNERVLQKHLHCSAG